MGTPPAEPDRAPTRPSRGVLVLGILAVAILAITLALLMGGRATSSPGDRAGSEHAATGPEANEASGVGGARVAARGAEDAGVVVARPTATEDLARTAPESFDHGVGLDVPPPPTPGSPDVVVSPQPEPRPERTQESFIERREQGLALLDTTRDRLEEEARDLERSGDAEGARRTRLRLTRLAAVRERRAEELEQARRGELVPEPYPESRRDHEEHEEEPGE